MVSTSKVALSYILEADRKQKHRIKYRSAIKHTNLCKLKNDG